MALVVFVMVLHEGGRLNRLIVLDEDERLLPVCCISGSIAQSCHQGA